MLSSGFIVEKQHNIFCFHLMFTCLQSLTQFLLVVGTALASDWLEQATFLPEDRFTQESGNLQMLRYDKIA